MKIFHDSIAQETIIEFDNRFVFFDLPEVLQKLLISNYFSAETRMRFAQTCKQAKLLSAELTYDYPINKTWSHSFLINQLKVLNIKERKLKELAKSPRNHIRRNLKEAKVIAGVIMAPMMLLDALLAILFGLSIADDPYLAGYLAAGGILLPIALWLPLAHTLLHLLNRPLNRMKKLADEIHTIKVDLIRNIGNEPRLKPKAEALLKTMNFRS